MEPDASTNHWSREVIGAAIEVHRILGPGFRESVYEEALAHEFRLRCVPFQRQSTVPILYKGSKVGRGRMDFVVAACIVVDLKSIEGLSPIHTSQVLSYLKETGLPLGLLINFNERLLKQGIRRIVLTQ